MRTEAALSAARHLSVDVANLSFRLAVAEAIQEEMRGLLFYEGLDGVPLRRADPNLWQERTVSEDPDAEQSNTHREIVLTMAQADEIVAIINALQELL